MLTASDKVQFQQLHNIPDEKRFVYKTEFRQQLQGLLGSSCLSTTKRTDMNTKINMILQKQHIFCQPFYVQL
jgi:hypothetical protein